MLTRNKTITEEDRGDMTPSACARDIHAVTVHFFSRNRKEDQ